MKHIGLFEGIGGFSIAARKMGWQTVAWCEKDPFCQRVLSYHFPDAKKYEDIKTTDFTFWRGKIDILTGGFPCQPFSLAGKGKGTADDRHLWPEMHRAIREIQPRYVVGENVFGIINRDAGLVFEQVQADLENEGYEVQPVVLPAASVGAPHRRDRVWFVAYRTNSGAKGMRERTEQILENRISTHAKSFESDGITVKKSEKRKEQRAIGICDSREITTNAISKRQRREGYRLGKAGFINQTSAEYDWENFPTQSPICGRNDGLPYGLDGITFSKWRRESIKAYGNAIVPQVAIQIFKAIESIENKDL